MAFSRPCEVLIIPRCCALKCLHGCLVNLHSLSAPLPLALSLWGIQSEAVIHVWRCSSISWLLKKKDSMLRYYISKGLFAIDRATDLTLFIIDSIYMMVDSTLYKRDVDLECTFYRIQMQCSATVRTSGNLNTRWRHSFLWVRFCRTVYSTLTSLRRPLNALLYQTLGLCSGRSR